MVDPMEDELVDYEEEDVAEEVPEAAADGKKGYVGIHSVGFKDFQLKPELVRAIQDCGFEHPSESTLLLLPSAFTSVVPLSAIRLL